ncbi:restriction endonuclease [Helicobacter pylori]|uniref:Restriction endonuclease n=2 Tax=Helicobacter pylori TaxID=210 RepID=A0A7K1NZ26_HELPX|nr:restriction endonuclease [Helicobacter pylori]MCJ8495235.1 restriction endonuclease [Helicobacter pylori]MUV09699.1 restriction endonuclease [Helicobacter pylori]UOS25606.1 restriction endonuclease [Helicobacter pylori]WQZ44460.1 restriction endonuclease [Helicobacter pylori]
MKESQIINFLKLSDYDIRKTQNARWIDQKCTPDVLSIVADCILEFTQYSIKKSFSVKDIWNNPYTNENVKTIFSKPDLNSDFSMHEYNKFFSQPIKLLAYSSILFETKIGNRNIYTIQNIELLEYLMQRETNALKFLILYIQKVLMDSGIYPLFDNFLQKQDTESFKQLKDGFTHFTINNTAINNTTECFRIFTKIINPLAFYYGKKGTRKGFLSNTIITKDELNYNRINWRDIGKNKNTTRQEHELISYSIVANSNYLISKAKKVVKQYNDNFNHSFSEVKGNEIVQATQIHHIFPIQDFPLIADYIENLIALTPNQHFIYAHPNNQTRLIDKDFQYICLLAKTNTIFNDTQGVYDLEHYIFVLNMGLKTTIFSQVNNKWELLRAIDAFYFDFNKSKDPSWQYLLDKNDLRAFKLKF